MSHQEMWKDREPFNYFLHDLAFQTLPRQLLLDLKVTIIHHPMKTSRNCGDQKLTWWHNSAFIIVEQKFQCGYVLESIGVNVKL